MFAQVFVKRFLSDASGVQGLERGIQRLRIPDPPPAGAHLCEHSSLV